MSVSRMGRFPPRRFQFHLRTLLTLVTLLAIPIAYVGRQAEIVRERKVMLDDGRIAHYLIITPDQNRLPQIRLWLGDVDCFAIYADQIVSDVDMERYRAAFPEAQVTRFTSRSFIR
jgi:hypothetical protein